jgi:hypothetical protein
VRKLTPKFVFEHFESDMNLIIAGVEELLAIGSLSTNTAALVAESSLLTGATYWEWFVSELLIAYVNRDSTKFTARLATRINTSISEKHGSLAAHHTSTTLPMHLSEASVRQLIDRKERNLSFSSVADLRAWTTANLSTAAAGLFMQLTAADIAAIEAWTAVRNRLAHWSRSSLTLMNQSLQKQSLHKMLRRGNKRVVNVSRFLLAVPAGGDQPRVRYYLDAMLATASRLI